MKKLYVVCFLLSTLTANSQVGINTSSPKSQLDIVANSPDNPSIMDGLLIPRLQRFPAAIPTIEQQGMLIYLVEEDKNFSPGFYYWNHHNKSWESLGGEKDKDYFLSTVTNSPPQNLREPMYRIGGIGIGTQEILSKVQIALNSSEDAAIKRGLEVDNNNPTVDNLTTYGIINTNRSATNGTKYGFKNNVSGQGNGIHYGIFTETFQNSGTNDIYGIFNRVGRTFGSRSDNYGIYTQIGTVQGSGNIYGIYSSALGDHNANVFAGYFAGRLGIGQTPQVEYIFPAEKGKTDQVLVLENNGNMKWNYPNTHNYSTTGGATGGFTITEDIYSLRINDQITSLAIPPANTNKGRIIKLLAWKGTKTKPFVFSGSDDIYDMVNDVSISSISGSQIMTIQSAGNRWILLDIRKAL